MKKILFLAIALVIGFSGFAQRKPTKISSKYQYLSTNQRLSAVDEPLNFSTQTNPTVAPKSSKSINEALIGTTRYDLQTNSSVQNRIYLYPDNTIGATFTFGTTETSFPERGTGYNYFDGSNWGTNPTARVESARCGWPSYCPLGNGELIVTHNGSNGLYISKRATKGTGTWSTTTLIGPTTTGGTTALLWPRTIASGNTIHIIACTDQATSPAIWYYQGLALALVYIRSTDGGTTWDAPVILPGMDSVSTVSNVTRGYAGDSYAWASAKGDTIAFIVGNSWQNTFVMKSYDGGTTWNKIPVFNFPTIYTFPTPYIPTNDGTFAIALDSLGKAHVSFGRMMVQRYTSWDSVYYRPYTDGLVYWNEDMPVLDTTALSDPNALNANGQLIAWMIDYDNDSIEFPVVPAGSWPFGTYGSSLSSMPSMTIDKAGDIFVSYSSVREDKFTVDSNALYRHLYIIKKEADSVFWSDPIDLTYGVIHDVDECIFGSMSPTTDNKIHLVYQADETVGCAVTEEANWGDNRIYYTYILKSEIGLENFGINENKNAFNMNIYPNPSTDYTYIDLNIAKSSNISVTVINLVGQQVINKDFGRLSSGSQKLAIGVSQLNSGIYFFTVQAGNDRITKKIIVE